MPRRWPQTLTPYNIIFLKIVWYQTLYKAVDIHQVLETSLKHAFVPIWWCTDSDHWHTPIACKVRTENVQARSFDLGDPYIKNQLLGSMPLQTKVQHWLEHPAQETRWWTWWTNSGLHSWPQPPTWYSCNLIKEEIRGDCSLLRHQRHSCDPHP